MAGSGHAVDAAEARVRARLPPVRLMFLEVRLRRATATPASPAGSTPASPGGWREPGPSRRG